MNDGASPQLVFVQQGEAREILNAELFDQLTQAAE